MRMNSYRSDFPILDQMVNGKPLIYFDNAATTQKPKKVIEVLKHYYEMDNANIHRGAHALADWGRSFAGGDGLGLSRRSQRQASLRFFARNN